MTINPVVDTTPGGDGIIGSFGFRGRPDGGRADRAGTLPGAGPEAPGTPVIRGGAHSIHANLDELEHGSMLLAGSADDAAALALRAAGWGTLLAAATTHTGYAGVLAARTAGLSAGLAAIGAEAAILHVGVREAADAYRQAEERARHAVALIRTPGAVASTIDRLATGRRVDRDEAELLLNVIPFALTSGLDALVPGGGRVFMIASDVTGHLARDPGRVGPLSASERLFSLTTAVGRAAGLIQVGPVTVSSVGDREPALGADGPARLEGTLPELLRTIELAGPHEAGPGAVRITAVTPQDGSGPVWVVSLPGTQMGEDSLDPTRWSTNPFDHSGIAEAMVLDSQHTTRAIGEALVGLEAQRGDRVVLAGYSLGGINAARVAADPRFAEQFDVQAVVTVGSPTGEIELPDDLEVLHLEHEQDIPAAGDGRPNPEGVRRTTVTFSGYGPQADLQEPSVFGPAHDLGNYGYHAGELIESEQAARLAPTLEHLSALTAGQAVSRTVRMERRRPGNPRHPLPTRQAGDSRHRAPVPAGPGAGGTARERGLVSGPWAPRGPVPGGTAPDPVPEPLTCESGPTDGAVSPDHGRLLSPVR